MNIKKLFPEKKISKKSIMEFIDKKGFYIVLILCIAIVGATAVFVTTRNITPSNTGFESEKIIPDEPGSNVNQTPNDKLVAQSSISQPSAATQPQASAKPVQPQTGAKENTNAGQKDNKQAVPPAENKPAAPDKNAAPKNNVPTIKPSFIMPVFGDICYDYAMDKLVYSKTLEEWRTHSGIDIAAERGVNIKAVADGVVTEIKRDPRLGVTVVIDHKNGFKTVYANLASGDMVSPNQKVKQGDVIGCIGETATFESAEQPHVHFEVLKGNEPVDPKQYLPSKT